MYARFDFNAPFHNFPGIGDKEARLLSFFMKTETL